MKKPFKNVAVVGTGILGTQIAMLAANVGYKVKVYDLLVKVPLTLRSRIERMS